MARMRREGYRTGKAGQAQNPTVIGTRGAQRNQSGPSIPKTERGPPTAAHFFGATDGRVSGLCVRDLPNGIWGISRLQSLVPGSDFPWVSNQTLSGNSCAR